MEKLRDSKKAMSREEATAPITALGLIVALLPLERVDRDEREKISPEKDEKKDKEKDKRPEAEPLSSSMKEALEQYQESEPVEGATLPYAPKRLTKKSNRHIA